MLNLEFAHGLFKVQPTVENLPKTAMEVVDFAVDFCGGFFGRKMQKKNPPKKSAGKSASRKQKIRRRTNPPPPNPPARPKDPPQNLPTNPSVKPPSTRRVFSIEKDCSWRRLQSTDVKPPSTRRVFSIEKDCSWRRLQSTDSGTLFGCLLVMVEAPMLKCTCNPSAAAGGMDKVCFAPFQTTLLVKSVRFEKTAQK